MGQYEAIKVQYEAIKVQYEAIKVQYEVTKILSDKNNLIQAVVVGVPPKIQFYPKNRTSVLKKNLNFFFLTHVQPSLNSIRKKGFAFLGFIYIFSYI